MTEIQAEIARSHVAPTRARRLKGLAREIRDRTDGLSEQINEMVRISLTSDHRHQVDAIKWLAERAYGKVPEISAFAELDQAEAQQAIEALTAPQLETLVSALQAVAADKRIEAR